MKKLLSILLVAVLLVTAMPLGAFDFKASAETSGTTGDCTWTLDGTILTISGNGKTENYCEEVYWPADGWVHNPGTTPWGTNITDLIVGADVTGFGSFNFVGCRDLKNIYITDIAAWCNMDFSLTCVNDYFNGYYTTSNPLDYAENLYLNGALVTQLVIPNSITKIEKCAFYNYKNLTSIIIPKSVTSIDYDAFYNCSKLKNVYYSGSEEEKSKIFIGYGNNYLTSATWYYNSCIHTYTSVCDRDCNVCGEFRRAPHKYDNACDDTCDLCGVEREVDDHVYSSICDVDCDECGAIRGGVVHTYDNTCDTVCNVCSATRTITHTYNNTCDTTCNVCGEIRTIKHTYENNCDADCNVCGELRTPPHKGAGVSCDFANATNYPFYLSGSIYSSTNKAHNSSATATITAKQTGTLTIKYYTSTESNCDILTIKLNNITKVTSSGETAWTTIDIPVVEGDVIYITYSKDGSFSNGDDVVKFELNQKSNKKCDETLICPDCNEILEYPEEHEYDNGCDIDCNICGVVRVPSDHVYGNSCDVDCNLCGFVRTVEHTFTNECDGECDICYETRKAPHKYNNACDTDCDLCGKKRSVPDHTYGDDNVCDECGHKNFVLGDIDDSGEVTLTDVVTLAQHIAEWDVECNEVALDVNGDGDVSLLDVVHLAQYVAEWEGIELH